MRYGVIDIGSNSVRLMLCGDDIDKKKYVAGTQVAEGLATRGTLSPKPMKRTADRIKQFADICTENHVDKVYCFATEAVRSAENGKAFCDLVHKSTGLDVHVLSGEEEARIGFLGAYTKGKCCVVDIGGASTEIIVGDETGIHYSKSLPIGIVRIKDICGTNSENATAYINAFLTAFGNVEDFDEVVMIGGTASTIVAMLERMEPFDEQQVHGYRLTKTAVAECYDYFLSVPLEYRNRITGLPQTKINIIGGGMILVEAIMDMLHVDAVTVGCNDNLEGYLMSQRNDATLD